MKMSLRGIILFLFFCLVAAVPATDPKATVKVTSPGFQDGGDIPPKFSHDGGNANPALRISGVPAQAKSLVVIVDDPDAPVGLFTHWLLWNVDPKTTEIGEHSVPSGVVQGTNDFLGQRYDGPQPPSGTHRYFFRVFALNQKLDLHAGAKRKELDAAMKDHVLAQGQLMGRFTKR